MLGSRIIFAGPIKVFTKVNKDRQRESNHVVYSLYNPDILGDSVNCRVGGVFRFDSNSKMKTSLLMEPSKEEVGVSCSDKAIHLSKNTPVISSVVSAEPARVQAKVEIDLEIKKIEYQGNTNIIDRFCWDHDQRFIPGTRNCVQESECRAARSCLLDP